MTMEAAPKSVAKARRRLRDDLDASGVCRSVDDCVLLLSELVTNAVEHAEGDGARLIHVNWWRVRTSLRIDVHGPGAPEKVRPRRPPASDTRGRGLLLVNRIADAWAVAPSCHGGTMVSFLMYNAWKPDGTARHSPGPTGCQLRAAPPPEASPYRGGGVVRG
ncbi:ATP-binding protein [Streptomyces pactum]|uniref:ATP-binding protein n=1 Tax=Streptomyces pactum TaxID=68249 RepID=UPI0036F8F009